MPVFQRHCQARPARARSGAKGQGFSRSGSSSHEILRIWSNRTRQRSGTARRKLSPSSTPSSAALTYGWGVRELAEELGASRSTVNRILGRLVEERLVSRDASGAYILGPRMKVLSAALQGAHPLFTEGTRILDRLRRASGATALMAVETGKPKSASSWRRWSLTPLSGTPSRPGPACPRTPVPWDSPFCPCAAPPACRRT
jgi:hypothetical protein